MQSIMLFTLSFAAVSYGMQPNIVMLLMDVSLALKCAPIPRVSCFAVFSL
jgi:hypothetical protein